MDGKCFYDFLIQRYCKNGQTLYNNYTFKKWLYKINSNSYSFSFNIPGNYSKSISREILIAAWEARQNIDDNWLKEKFGTHFHSDCRLYVLNFLIKKHQDLR
jgi:hypothetical protein